MRIEDHKIRQVFIILLVVSFILRAFLAFWLEFGNDEVYYVLYARFPDWSHFDHPPMIGWLMQVTSFNLLLNHEFYLRLSSVIILTFNTIIIFKIGQLIKNERTGLYAAILFNTSVYSGIITGIFILPDTPQNLFWIMSMWLILRIFNGEPADRKTHLLMMLTGLMIGLGMISKYTSVFIWFGIIAYIFSYDRRWLRQSSLYIALLISFVCFMPVLIWNFSNDFISFGFHTNRIAMNGNSFRFDYFLTEFAGEIIYSNPINYVIIVMAIIALIRKKITISKLNISLLLLLSLPLILTFLFFSLFRSTLPHWNGPAYSALLVISAAWLDSRTSVQKMPLILKSSMMLIILIITIGSLQINFGIVPFVEKNEYQNIGKNDISLDMYGWREIKPEFEKTRNRLISEGKMGKDCALLGENWFPLANFDFYVARPLGMKVFGIGELGKIHKYSWINDIEGGLKNGNDYWYLTTSRDYKNPKILFPNQFEEIIFSDTITIERNGKPVKRIFVFMLKGLKK